MMDIFLVKEMGITFEKVRGGIKSSNGYLIEDIHEQDWCESVYADWSSLDDTGFYDLSFKEIRIEFVEEVGFRINDFLVNCYNSQNGYYSSYLDLNITSPNGEILVLNITKYVEDRIN